MGKEIKILQTTFVLAGGFSSLFIANKQRFVNQADHL